MLFRIEIMSDRCIELRSLPAGERMLRPRCESLTVTVFEPIPSLPDITTPSERLTPCRSFEMFSKHVSQT